MSLERGLNAIRARKYPGRSAAGLGLIGQRSVRVRYARPRGGGLAGVGVSGLYRHADEDKSPLSSCESGAALERAVECYSMEFRHWRSVTGFGNICGRNGGNVNAVDELASGGASTSSMMSLKSSRSPWPPSLTSAFS